MYESGSPNEFLAFDNLRAFRAEERANKLANELRETCDELLAMRDKCKCWPKNKTFRKDTTMTQNELYERVASAIRKLP